MNKYMSTNVYTMVSPYSQEEHCYTGGDSLNHFINNFPEGTNIERIESHIINSNDNLVFVIHTTRYDYPEDIK